MPCPHGPDTLRYANRDCIECRRVNGFTRRASASLSERDAAQKSTYYLANKEKINAASKRYRERAKYIYPWVTILQRARERAEQRGLAYDLDAAWARTSWTGRCAITDIPFRVDTSGNKGPKPFSASIDRIDCNLGYTKENCRFILMCVNNFRGTLGDEDMLLIASAIAARNILKVGAECRPLAEGIAA